MTGLSMQSCAMNSAKGQEAQMIPSKRRQTGCIVFGTTLNKRQWIENAKAEGYFVLDCGEYAELYIRAKDAA